MTFMDFFLQLAKPTSKVETELFSKPNWISLSAPGSVGGVGGANKRSSFFGFGDGVHWYDFRFFSLSGFPC